MATINAASSDNNVNRMRFSKGRTLLLYSDRDPTADTFLGVAQFVSRLSVTEYTATTPFTIA
jgi:hypothetical protein